MKLYENMYEWENLSWCKPMATDDGKVWMICHEGEKPTITAADGARISDGTKIQALARAYNADYDDAVQNGDGATDILRDAMRECGCCKCPLRDKCECMENQEDESDNDAV